MGKRIPKWRSAMENDVTYIFYLNRITEMAMSIFEWKNLPPTIDPRFLEYTLFTDGMALFFEDEVIGPLALQTMIGGPLDVYRIPIDRVAYASNGYHAKLTESNSVLCFNNYMHTNMMNGALNYAQRLYNIERTLDINLNSQKTPLIIKCSENEKLTLKNLYMQWEGNEPVIYGDKNADLDTMKVLKTDAPFLADKLQQLKTDIWNEMLTWLGIPNLSIAKKERMITDEVNRSIGGTVDALFTRLNARKEACQMVNNMFGWNIDVVSRIDLTGKGGDENGEVYNDASVDL